MYHDQGHIALKLLGMHQAVNVTLGLPIIRTSVAHGTAFDIAWKRRAETSSMIEALRVASRLASSPARGRSLPPERNRVLSPRYPVPSTQASAPPDASVAGPTAKLGTEYSVTLMSDFRSHSNPALPCPALPCRSTRPKPAATAADLQLIVDGDLAGIELLGIEVLRPSRRTRPGPRPSSRLPRRPRPDGNTASASPLSLMAAARSSRALSYSWRAI